MVEEKNAARRAYPKAVVDGVFYRNASKMYVETAVDFFVVGFGVDGFDSALLFLVKNRKSASPCAEQKRVGVYFRNVTYGVVRKSVFFGKVQKLV